MVRALLNPRGMPETEYVVGVDLGQKQDYTAVSVVERSNLLTGEVCPVTYEHKRELSYWLRYLERVKLGTSYVDIVTRVRELVMDPNLAGRCTLVVDATGVGGPVVDLLRRARLGCPLIPVMITGGDRESESGGYWRVPKRELVVGLQVMFEEKMLRIAGRIPETDALMRELMNMRVKVSEGGHDSYAGRDGAHDDLVLAVALACWRARRKRWDLFGTRNIGIYG